MTDDNQYSSTLTEPRSHIRLGLQQYDLATGKPPVRLGTIMNVYSLAIAVVPVIVVVLIALNLFSNQARDQVVDQLSSIALLKSREINRWLETNQVTLDLVLTNSEQYRRMLDILESPGLPGLAGRNVTNFLQNQLDMQSAYQEFFLYNTDGIVRVSTNSQQVGADLINQGQDYVEMSLNPDLSQQEGGLAAMVHPAYYDYFSGEVNIIITQPLRNEITNDIVGILAGRLNSDALAEIMTNRVGLGEKGETYLISGEFHNLITPSRFMSDPSAPQRPRRQTSIGIDRGLNGETGSAFYNSYLGDKVIGVYRWIPSLQTALIAEDAETEALHAVRDVRNASIVVALITGLIAVIIGQVATRFVTRPIAQLQRVTQAVMRGDYTERANLRVITEIGQLGQAFDTMTTELVQAINERNVRIRQAEELSESLETRVKARTRDLEVAAQVAQQITNVLDLHELLNQVVNLTATSFDLYNCQIYTYDEMHQMLYLDAGVIWQDQQMIPITDDLSIPFSADPSVIALAARSQEMVVVNDIQQSSIYMPHEQFSETRSELAIPLRLGNRLLGIFDLHGREINRFGEEDISVLTTLAEQISVAIQNANLFAESRRARAEAEQANQVKSQFLANMSHELRTPLNAILNFTEFVADGVLGEVNEEQVDALHKAIDSGEHLLSLINDVLDLTKIEVGMMELFVEELDLNKLLQSVMTTARGLVSNKKDVALTMDIDPELPVFIGDKRRVRQIMLNLISNAVKFTPVGTIAVSTRLEDGQILLTVKDTGVGIPPDDHDLIFESFRQTKNVRIADAGTGLGLPITRHLVEAHGGKIWLESEVNQGTTFYVSLPLRQSEASAG